MSSIKNKTFILATYSVVSLLFLILIGTTGYAQGAKDFSFNIQPGNPGTNEKVQLQISTFSFDIDRSEVTWYVDGKEALSGIGERVFAFTTGGLGTESIVKATIVAPDDTVITRSLTIRPMRVNLVWEAISYTPPFYKGRAHVPPNGLVLVTAIPELTTTSGKKIDPDELVYTWQHDGFVMGKSSGYGKNRIVVPGARIPLLTTNVSVAVSSFDGSVTGESSVSIPTAEPKVYFYEKHPLEGIRYHSAIRGFSLTAEEITVRAEPFYFSLDDVASGNLQYRWKINKTDISIPVEEQINEIVLQREGDIVGSANVSLNIRTGNLDRILQQAENKFNIEYGF